MMQAETKKPNLGKLLKVGDTFETTTKRMSKPGAGTNYQASCGNKYEVLKPGDIRTFTKGKRNYVCEVQGMIELRTGVHWFTPSKTIPKTVNRGYRWYMFTYVVKILQN